MSDEAPKGALFSELYIRKGAPSLDSPRARRRMHAYFLELVSHNEQRYVSDAIRLQQGINLARMSVEVYYLFEQYFAKEDLRDILDSVTIVARVLRKRGQSRYAELWIDAVRLIFRDEHLQYRVDDLGGVHYSPDAEFDRNRASALSVLESARYGNARAAFERGTQAFDESPPDGKGAVAGIFEATEVIFRLLIDDTKCQRLGTDEIDSFLLPKIRSLYAEDDPALLAATLFAKSLKQWVSSCHFQRHGQPVEDPYQPPLELAVALFSAGAGYLRWLAQIEAMSVNGQVKSSNAAAK